ARGFDHHHFGCCDIKSSADRCCEIGCIRQTDIEVEVAASYACVGSAVVVPEYDQSSGRETAPQCSVVKCKFSSAVVRHVGLEILDDHPAHIQVVLNDEELNHITCGRARVEILVHNDAGDHNATRSRF